jgi:DNA-binding MarR family transcriptional regulator
MTDRGDLPTGELIMSAILRLGRRLRAERPPDSVPLSQLSALTYLARQGPMPAARLAGLMRLQPQSLTRLIAALEEDGLIERSPGEVDRRTILLEATRTGRAAVRHDLSARRAWLERAMHAELGAGERAALEAAVPAMLKLADAESASP